MHSKYPAVFTQKVHRLTSPRHRPSEMRHRLKPDVISRGTSPTVSPTVSRSKKPEAVEVGVKQQSPQIFHPDLFEGLIAEIYFDDATELEIARRNLEVIGATVMRDGDSNVPDVIVTKSSSLRRNLAIEIARAKYMETIKTGRIPKVVTDKQIPWVFWPTKKLEAIRDARNVKIVVADASEKCRPAFKVISEPVVLRLDPVPPGYMISPFLPIEEVEKRTSSSTTTSKPQEIAFTASPPDHGFCELCKVTFGSAEEHHASKEHLSKIDEAERWSPLDALISHVTAMHRL